jgi:hypothetical protein
MDLTEGNLANPITHWYYKHKFWFVEKIFRRYNSLEVRVLDVGAGSALFSKKLVNLELVATAVALDTGYSEGELNQAGPISYTKSCGAGGFTHILMTDVLEHIADDSSFLTSYVSEADEGTQFVITVPAMMNLWSSHDIYLKHYRRYRKSELRTLLESSGLKVRQIRYLYSTVYPLAFLSRMRNKKTSPATQLKDFSVPISALLTLLLIPDKWISFLPFGVSILATGEKD